MRPWSVGSTYSSSNNGNGIRITNGRSFTFLVVYIVNCEWVILIIVQQDELQPTRLLCLWDSLGKNTGVGCHFLLQGNLPNPGVKPRSPTLQADSLPCSHQRSPQALPFNYEHTAATNCSKMRNSSSRTH